MLTSALTSVIARKYSLMAEWLMSLSKVEALQQAVHIGCISYYLHTVRGVQGPRAGRGQHDLDH